jgi:hypothetical protein
LHLSSSMIVSRRRPTIGAAPESQTKPKFAISVMSPADGTIAARVAPLGIRRFPLAAQKQINILSGQAVGLLRTMRVASSSAQMS